MALRKFTPDPDLFDPEDDNGWYGTWEHDDGSSLYGQGDPELGRELMASSTPAAPPTGPDLRLAQNAPEPTDYRHDAAPALAPPPMIAKRPEPPEEPPPPMLARPPEQGGGWEVDVPPQVSRSLAEQAQAAGLDPAALAAVIKHESGWDPSIGSKGDAGKDRHAGLIQFSEKLWPGVAEAAGRPDVTFDEMRAMSAEEQIPFVLAYYKGKGLSPQSSVGDYRLATYKPAHLGKADDFVLDDAASAQGIPVTPDNARLDKNRDGIINSYEQNAGLDRDGDGKVTAGEVRGGPSGGVAPRGNASGAGGAGGFGGMAPLGSLGGMPLAEAQMSGLPLSPQQVEQRQGAVRDRYAAVSAMQQAAQQERIAGRQEVQQAWQQAYEQQGKDAAAEEAKQAAIAAEAAEKIDREVNQPIQRVNPKRYLQEMSTGAAVLGAIGVVLAGLGQAKAMSMGMNPGSNAGLDALNKAIDQDVQLQKEEIQRGQERSQNRIAHWSRILGNAEQGERAARAEAKQAAGGLLQARAMNADTAELRAAGMEKAAVLFAQGQQEIQAIADEERKKLTLRYAVPAPRAGVDPVKQALEMQENAKRLYQERILAGRTPEQAAQEIRAAGLPLVTGDTVDQSAARKASEAKADEETSKELQPVTEAENMWNDALKQLDSLEQQPLTGGRYKPGGFVESITSSWPGFPSMDEQNAFNQALTAATNAQIAALGRASDSDEDRIRSETIGGGDVRSLRRGIQNQLRKLEERRKLLNARRAGAADRVTSREHEDDMPVVSGRIGAP